MEHFRVINGPQELKYYTIRKERFYQISEPKPAWVEVKGEIDVVDRETGEKYKRVMVKFNHWHPSYWMRRRFWLSSFTWQCRFYFLKRRVCILVDFAKEWIHYLTH